MVHRRRIAGVLVALMIGAGALVGVGSERTMAQPQRLFEPAMITGPDFHPTPTDASSAAQIRAANAWVAAGTLPGAGTRWEALSRTALVDLHYLISQSPSGVPAAGAGDRWDYFWPRDGAFVAVALHRTGHHEEAHRIVSFLSDLPFDRQAGFDARYQLDGTRVVDRPRGPQTDGCGWVLWMLSELTSGPNPLAGQDIARLRTQCTDHLLTLTNQGLVLPPPSPDYWEVTVSQVSLGTAAPILIGLQAAAADYARTGEVARSTAARDAAQRLQGLVTRRFGPDYQRFGNQGGWDAATGFLMPPFGTDAGPLRQPWLTYQREASRESGGLAPGSDWKADGTSWTPEVAMVALTAAAIGRSDIAARWLDWLAEHVAPWGSLPEKVTRSGRPAGPAPLVWTGASVLLALDALDATGGAGGAGATGGAG